MDWENAKDLTLSILVIVAVTLLADCVWLHLKSARQAEALAALEAKVECHINPPPESSMTQKAKDVYEKAKAATVRQYEKAKAATAEGFRAMKDEYNKQK